MGVVSLYLRMGAHDRFEAAPEDPCYGEGEDLEDEGSECISHPAVKACTLVHRTGVLLLSQESHRAMWIT